MTKKIALLMVVMLLASALVFVSCSQNAGGGGGGGQGGFDADDLEPVENVLGEVRDISVPISEDEPLAFYNGDFEESATSSDVLKDGSSTEIVSEPGNAENHVLEVTTSESYGCVYVDLTEYYGRGKSFYVEASFKKAEGGTNVKAPVANITFTICSGAVQAEADRQYAAGVTDEDSPGQYYYYDDIYGSPALSDADALQIFGMTTHKIGANLNDGAWHTVSAIIDAVEIDDTLQTQTVKYKGSDLTMAHFYAVLYVGEDESDLAGYKYYLDNVVIKDLNDDLDRGGQYEREEEDPQAT